MRRLADALYLVTLTLWVGGSWAVGYLVAPVLFATLPDRALAGMLAGRVFAVIGWVGLGCGAYLLLFLLLRNGAAALRRWLFWLVLLMLALTAASQFGVQPLMAQLKGGASSSGELVRGAVDALVRDRFAVWHGISSVLYLLQSLLGLMIVMLSCREMR